MHTPAKMKTGDRIVDTFRNRLKDTFKGYDNANETQLFLDVDTGAIREASKILVEEGGRYQVSVGYDNIEIDNTFGLTHNFAFDRDNLFVILRTSVDADNPVIESITPDIPGAGWSEREYMDLLGMKFTGHPDPRRLVLADDWPEGIYPMRKEVPHDMVPPGAEDVAYQLDEAPEGTTIIPVGPFHPSLHEPEHFAVYVDGETIKGCDYRGFMTHRGIEKLCQSQVSYNEIPFIAERICGICGSVHATAYSQAVEMAGGITISRRAEYIRTIMLEIERLHSHLLWLGVAGHLIGFDTVFMHSWRVREDIMWLCEKMTGNRKTYGMIVIGGVRRDINTGVSEEILNVLAGVEKEVLSIEKAIIKDSAIHKRSRDVGVITKEEAIKWSLVGPVARARGIDIDVRRDLPYAAYDDMEFDVPVVESCDVWGTLVVRIKEIYESISIIRQALKGMPDDGPLCVELESEIEPYNHAVTSVEAPRGESVHYIITGNENRPDRWRVRAPTYPNLQAVPEMLLHNQFGDFPIILGSIDPCFSCTDRVQVVNLKENSMKVMSRKELEGFSRNISKEIRNGKV